MGNTESVYSIVESWKQNQQGSEYAGPKCDVIELTSNKKMVIIGIGVMRPNDGTAHVSIEIRSLEDDVVVTSEKFTIEADSDEKSEVKQLERERVLRPGVIYRIIVLYEGASCKTYDTTVPMIKNEGHVVTIRRNLDASTEFHSKQLNLITDLEFELFEKGRNFCA
jgi:hypothetical protein